MCQPYNQKTFATVRDGFLHASMHTTIGEAFGKFLADPHWSTGRTTEGMEFVNLSGGMTYRGKDVTAHLQFLFDLDGNYSLHALDFDGTPQDSGVLANLILKVYDNAYPPDERIVGKWGGSVFAFNFTNEKCSVTGPFGVDYGQHAYHFKPEAQQLVIDSPMFAPFTYEFDDDDHLALTNTENGHTIPLERQKS
jgi:hypothetical protein